MASFGGSSSSRRAPESNEKAEPSAAEIKQIDPGVDPKERVETPEEREQIDVARVVIQEAQEHEEQLRRTSDERFRCDVLDRFVMGLDRRLFASQLRATDEVGEGGR